MDINTLIGVAIPQSDGLMHVIGGPDSDMRAEGMLVAMINAARSDGRIDKTERAQIEGSVARSDLSENVQHFIMAELSRPLDVARVAAYAETAEIAADLYEASLIGAADLSAAERDYLSSLGDELSLPDNVRKAIEDKAGVRV